MILRAALVGFVLWLAFTGAFWFWGDYILLPSREVHMILFAACIPVAAILTWLSLGVLGADPGDRAEAGVSLAFPGMLLSAFTVNNFQEIFPRIDPLQGQAFATLMLLWHATILLTGLMTTQISERDEQI